MNGQISPNSRSRSFILYLPRTGSASRYRVERALSRRRAVGISLPQTRAACWASTSMPGSSPSLRNIRCWSSARTWYEGRFPGDSTFLHH